MASELGELCETHQIVVGVAESLTCSKNASQLAAAPGSGNWLGGAVVAYFSDVKHQLLKVPRGPVISQTAAESMASSA
ncbi:CinA family protein [Brevibacterium sp. CFH 10365]|uniref:CinA family protein n=1 Tax=Brevibacterium sp. CFH 10365 TaxID=2585207 RepID=UPI0039B6F523